MNPDPAHRTPGLSIWRSLEVIGYVYSASVFGLALFFAFQFHLGNLNLKTIAQAPVKSEVRRPAMEPDPHAAQAGVPVAGSTNAVSDSQAN